MTGAVHVVGCLWRVGGWGGRTRHWHIDESCLAKFQGILTAAYRGIPKQFPFCVACMICNIGERFNKPSYGRVISTQNSQLLYTSWKPRQEKCTRPIVASVFVECLSLQCCNNPRFVCNNTKDCSEINEVFREAGLQKLLDDRMSWQFERNG